MLRLILPLIALIASCKSTPQPNSYMAEGYGHSDKSTPAPMKPQAAPYFGIIFMGDTGEPGPDQAKVAKAIENFCAIERCSIGLLLGDNFYPKGVSSENDVQFRTKFEEPYKNLDFRFYVVLGNHDVLGNGEAQVKYRSPKWTMPSQYYSMDAGWINFYGLDTNWSAFQRPFHSQPQRDWLEAELAKGSPTWKIAFGHHPVYSSGFHGDTLALKKYLVPMLEKAGVDFYLSGHDHDKQLFEGNGVKYVVVGTGAKLRSARSSTKALFTRSSLGFGHLLLTEKSASLRFVNEKGEIEFEKKYIK